MEDERIRVSLELIITREDIDNILSGALDGGITYWCGEAEVVGKYLGEYASEQISRGGELVLHDIEYDAAYLLNLEKMISGIERWVADGPKYGLELEGGSLRLDCGMIDAASTDVIVQYALFGQILFC